ncbi:MAG: hypothetical protein IJP31_07390 [Lachnospiraceae bacterium]|nr:hypothetical protein [Lachnospiraceae bacterium]
MKKREINIKRFAGLMLIVMLLAFLFVQREKDYWDESMAGDELMAGDESMAGDELMEEIDRINDTYLKLRRYPLWSVISDEEDDLYRKIYLEMLQNERMIIKKNGEKVYVDSLFTLDEKGDKIEGIKEAFYQFDYYYEDLDGDEKPELGVGGGHLYLFDYEEKEGEIYLMYQGTAMYDRIMGTGLIWHHDGTHAGVVRDYFEVLNEEGDWERVLELEEGESQSYSYYSVRIQEGESIEVDRKTWLEMTYDIFRKLRALPLESETLTEVFGDVLQ